MRGSRRRTGTGTSRSDPFRLCFERRRRGADDAVAVLRDEGVEEDEELRATLALYKAKKRAEEEMSVAETEEDDEAPHVDMNELLDDFDELTMEDRPMQE